ncbi:MAG: hypothetical protein A2Z99_09950 [Treponema sp. GWB1_62_6]|nr:MAG: hypothetical protein A2Y36_02250 [Treponema sp. GWA1_62_8]OHE66369.1 MAG: hypothetical protein A2Z99_09950 [Treponema sp. GWB1_62_6]OHE66462.1 MAG: hypothetical protein A2001_17615 [Treponema sp. GWC1_61_84]OHE68491.1 MAG: hypothetical protein A2413_06760 [Treponema sp. RIFOXYC1_FULL_61_9]HCM29107.1 hypothetical protein [Treponema sp.]
MPVLVRIAFRNMREHKAKSLIIGILVALGVIVIVVGNAMMDASAAGIRRTFIESYTGDLMVHGPSESAVSVFGVESFSMDADTQVPTIPEYEKVLARVRADSRVAAATSMAVAYGLLAADADETIVDSSGDEGNVSFAIVFGVEAETYFDMFPSIILVRGRFLETGESAILLNQDQLDKLAKKYEREFDVGDKILLSGFGTAGMRIREVEIVGVITRKEMQDEGPPLVISDIDTVRVLGGLTLAGTESIDLDASQTALLSAADADAIFGDDLFSGDMVDSSIAAAAPASFDSAASLLGDTSKRELLNTADSGAWNFILLRLSDSGTASAAMADLKTQFAADGIDARIEDWKGAAGTNGKIADIVRIVFNIALVVIAVVSVIIMMNTLVISVIERTSEIGTMRALGAKKSFIRSMFLTETLTLTIVFGFIGSAIALAAIGILNALKIPAANDFMRLLFGGATLTLTPRIGSFIGTIAMVFAVGYLAHLYPVAVALKIQPVAAMRSE